MEKTLENAIENRILLGISLYGPDVIPYNMTFVEKYSLKELFFAYLDSKTNSNDVRILSRHIKECAGKYLVKDIKESDRIILEEIRKNGLGCTDRLFPDKKTSKMKSDFLNEYNLLIHYELYTGLQKMRRSQQDDEIELRIFKMKSIERLAQINIDRILNV